MSPCSVSPVRAALTAQVVFLSLTVGFPLALLCYLQAPTELIFLVCLPGFMAWACTEAATLGELPSRTHTQTLWMNAVFIILVTTVILFALWVMDDTAFHSAKTFITSASNVLIITAIVVGVLNALYGPPTIERVPNEGNTSHGE
jgi:hypothetical protein